MPSRARTARPSRSTRPPAKSWPWSACPATTRTCSSTASATPTGRRCRRRRGRCSTATCWAASRRVRRIKPFMALAGLEAGLRSARRPDAVDRRVLPARAAARLPRLARGRPRHGQPARVPGAVGEHLLLQAGRRIWASTAWTRYFQRLGFGEPTGIDLTGEIAGVRAVAGWKRKQLNAELVPGRHRQRRHRPGLLGDDAAADGAGHRDAGQRRRAPPAAPGARQPGRVRPAAGAGAAAAGVAHRARRCQPGGRRRTAWWR